MRNYTSKSQKIDLYSQKYNLSKEEVYRILSEYEDILTLDELKIRYDNENIGVLPEWLLDDELDSMIWNTIHQMFDTRFSSWTTKDDLHSDLQLFVRKNSNKFRNHAHLKTCLINRLKTLLDERSWRGKYYENSIDEEDTYSDSNSTKYKYEKFMVSDTKEQDELELVMKINSIKDEKIRNLIIVTGYLICNISCLRKDYLQLLRTSEQSIKQNLKLLEDKLFDNDEIDRKRIDKVSMPSIRKKSLNIVDVMKALKLYVFSNNSSANLSLKEAQNYLQDFDLTVLLNV